MDPVDNNQFEVVPPKTKRKIPSPCFNVYLNPALDLLANEDPMCNTAMEIVPIKKRKRTRSCDIVAFENSALDLGISKVAVNEFLVRELENVRKNVRPYHSTDVTQTYDKRNISEPTLNFSTIDFDTVKPVEEPVYANLPSRPDLPPRNKSTPIVPDSNNLQTVTQTFKDTNLTIPPARPPKNFHTFVNFSKNQQPLCLETNLDESNIIAPTNYDTVCGDMSVEENVNVNIPVIQIFDKNAVANNVTQKIDTNKQELDVEMSEVVQNDMNTPLENIQAKPVAANQSEVIIEENVIQNYTTTSNIDPPTDMNVDSGISILEQKSLNPMNSDFHNLDVSAINNTTNIQTNITNQVFVNSPSLSFIDRLALDSPNFSNRSLCLDDDLNESNIMEVKTITIITKTKRVIDKNKFTNPFLDPNLKDNVNKVVENPFSTMEESKPELEYNDEILNRPPQVPIPQTNEIFPRRLLFSGDTITNSTVSTVDDSVDIEQHEYENVDGYRSESPIYENVCEEGASFNKQSKILGQDVSHFSAVDIMNLNRNSRLNCVNSSNDSNDSKKDLKHQILKAGKFPKKVFKKLKKTFKGDKSVNNVTLNPYEIPRKIPKSKEKKNESGIENPALNLDNSDEIEIFEDIDDEEHQYETIKTLRNTRLNMNVTPLKERVIDNIDISHNRSTTPGKKVRFDSTLNQEKIITGNSFDYDIQSPGFDAKIEKYHDELENCINERKILQQNM